MSKNKVSELVDAQYSECAWIQVHARNLVYNIINKDMPLDEAYESLQGMKKAVANTPGAC